MTAPEFALRSGNSAVLVFQNQGMDERERENVSTPVIYVTLAQQSLALTGYDSGPVFPACP